MAPEQREKYRWTQEARPHELSYFSKPFSNNLKISNFSKRSRAFLGVPTGTKNRIAHAHRGLEDDPQVSFHYLNSLAVKLSLKISNFASRSKTNYWS